MFLLYNGQIIPEEKLHLPLSNRGFQYNDGFFETIILQDGALRFWPEHKERIAEAASILGLQLQEELLADSFPALVLHLAELNHCQSFARVKLKAWRAGAGLYTPQTDEVDWLVTAQPAQSPSAASLKVGICQSVKTIPSVFSSFKGVNSPVYVLASREKESRQMDDLLLLDPTNNLAELTFSNLFWIKDEVLFTPALQTGCLNGIMRRKLLQWARSKGLQVQEGLFSQNELAAATVVFAGNVTGLRVITEIENQVVSSQPSLAQDIQEEIFQD